MNSDNSSSFSEDNDGPMDNIPNLNNNEKEKGPQDNLSYFSNKKSNTGDIENSLNDESDNISSNDSQKIEYNYNNDKNISDNDSQNESESKEGDIKINIILYNDKIETLYFNIGDDIYDKVNHFCKKNNYGKKEREIISKQINQKMQEIINNIENENKNKKLNKINNKKTKKNEINKSFDAPIKRNKFCLDEYDEIGHKLYYRELEHKLKKEKNLEKKRLENSKLSPDITFQPKLTEKTRRITKNINNKIKIEDRLIALGKEREKKLLKKVAEKSLLENNKNNLDDNSEYSYQPKINKYNLNRNKSEDIFTKLYKDGKNKQKKSEKMHDEYYKEQCPFIPQITKMAKNMSNKKYMEIIEQNYKKKDNIKNNILKENTPNNKKIKNNIQKENNIHKNKKNKNNILNKEYNNNDNNGYVINYKNTNHKNKNNQNNNEDNNNINEVVENKKFNEKRKKKWDEYSKNLIKHIKEVKFKELFDLLDRNKKKYISYSNISYNDIPENIMIALTPVIDEINRNKNKKIYYQEFREITDESLSACMLDQ